MKKSSASPPDQPQCPDLEFPDAPDFVSFPPRLTLDEYDHLNQLWKEFMPPNPESRIETEIREEFILM